MHFLQAEMLWALLLAPMLVGFYLYLIRRRRRQVLAFSSLRLIHEAMASSSRWRRHLPPALVGIAFVLALLAMARPVARITLPADYMTLVMAMDVSRSMLATDVEPNRIQAAQKAAKEFLQALPAGVRVAIVSFAGTAQVVQHVSDRREDWVAALDRFQLPRGPATGSGLLMALSPLRPDAPIQLESTLYGGASQRGIGEAQGQSLEDRRKSAPTKEIVPVPPGSYTGGAIVLLSDGRRTTGPDPLEAAKLAANLGVRVYTVGFGTPNGFIPGYEGYSFFTQVDEETLKAVANVTEAEYFKAGTAEELKKVYEHLSSQFTLERKDTEVSALMAGAALMLLLLALALSVRWFRAGAPKLLGSP